MFSSTTAIPKTCGECEEKKGEEARATHLRALAELPTEERLRLLEEFAYDHSKRYHPGRPARF